VDVTTFEKDRCENPEDVSTEIDYRNLMSKVKIYLSESPSFWAYRHRFRRSESVNARLSGNKGTAAWLSVLTAVMNLFIVVLSPGLAGKL
jgi:hypothetical protein